MELLSAIALALLSSWTPINPSATAVVACDQIAPALAAPQCTAIGSKVIGGDIFFGGCPSNACDGGDGTSPCQANWNMAGTRVFCECENGPDVACRATVRTAPGQGGVTGWSCRNLGCDTSRVVAVEPLPTGSFYFCFC